MGTAVAAVSVFWTPLGGIKQSLGASLETATAYIQTKALHIGRDDFTYFIDKINSNITNNTRQTSLVLEIYASEAENGPFTLVDEIDMSIKDPGFTDPPGARYYKFIWRDSSIKERWRLHGFAVYGEPGGEEF